MQEVGKRHRPPIYSSFSKLLTKANTTSVIFFFFLLKYKEALQVYVAYGSEEIKGEKVWTSVLGFLFNSVFDSIG